MLRRMGQTEKTISSMRFTCFNADEIRNLSVKEVTNPHTLDAAYNPMEGGLYDPAYGATKDEFCTTCQQGSVQCPGHMGHIELPLPVYHPLFFKTLYYLLRGSCMQCQKLLIPRHKLVLLAFQIDAVRSGLVQTVFDLKDAANDIKGLSDLTNNTDDTITSLELQDHLQDVLKQHYDKFLKDSEKNEQLGWSRNVESLHLELISEFVRLLAKNVSRCPHCSASVVNIRTEHSSKIYVVEPKEKTGQVTETSQVYLTPSDIHQHLEKLWENEKNILSRVYVAMGDADPKQPKEQCDGDTEPAKPGSSAVDVLLLNLLPVPPSRFRPMASMNDKYFESPQTTAYSKILKDCVILRALLRKLNKGETDATFEEEEEEDVTQMGRLKIKMTEKNVDLLSSIPGKTLGEKLENAWHRLQQHVNSLFDADLDRLAMAGTVKTPGFKQLLEKKDGLFRKNIMGKRVNFAARSVISPDPYIATNEVGVPLVFATRLTYPAPVTPWNVKVLRKAVINGPKVHPGATHVVSGNRTILLHPTNVGQREAVARQLLGSDDYNKDTFEEPKVVMRHIQTGDVMLVNRQPTLHKGSIMAHKVRVLPGEKTLRLHYANCKSYNADFDGDEMNAHLPQSEAGRSEAYQLMLTDKQYLSGKDGKPLSCLIQDHMVAGVSLSLRGRFFTRESYQQLLYNALLGIPRKIKQLKPALLKPQVMWSGKQLMSSVLINIIPGGLPNINYTGKSKIGHKEWKKGGERTPVVGILDTLEMCESQVIISNGELLCGVLDKAHYGATEHGLVHSVYELYGGEVSGKLLTCFSRLFTAFLQQYKGFTLGVEDILVTSPADAGRTHVIEATKDDGMRTVAKTLNVKDRSNEKEITDALWDAHVTSRLSTRRGEDKMAAVDHAMKSVSNSVNDEIAKWCTGNGLLKTFPENNLQLMVKSGAKGGAVNCMQISCLLGQIELEGRRPPLMPSGRSLPSFKPYDTSLRAGGFISQRFLTGIRPQEYFFHCMAGREGLIDTAVKTSRSGYLQRCLIKHLEGLVLSYDMTVRDSDGSVVQFLYGEDGIDVAKSSYLQQGDFVVNNFKAIESQLPSLADISSLVDVSSAPKKMRKFDRARKKRDKLLRKSGGVPPRSSPFLKFSEKSESGDKAKLFADWRSLSRDERAKHIKKWSRLKLPDPVQCTLQPDRYFGSTSERFYDDTKTYLACNDRRLPASESKKNKLPSVERLDKLLKLRYQRSLLHPGEGVGLLAAQSIGEPSTQMTLNTFHFAGRGEMNVTLGIPRLREILMVASKQIKTPQITVPVVCGMERKAKKLCKALTKVMLSQVLHKASLEERLVVGKTERRRKCVIEMRVLPEKQLLKDFALSRDHVLRHIEKRFLRSLFFAITKRLLQADDGLIIEQRAEKVSRDSHPNDDQDESAPVEDVPEEDEAPKNDEMDYEDQDNVEEEVETPDNNETIEPAAEDESPNDSPAQDNQPFSGGEDVDTEEEEKIASGARGVDHADAEMRIRSVKNLGVGQVTVEDYQFDVYASAWCKVTLLMPLTSARIDLVSLTRDQAEATPVRKVEGISRCMLAPVQGANAGGRMNMVAEGVNFYKMHENEEILEVDRMYCNCIHSVANTFGIEAARRVVVNEIANVFGAYGIEVNPRHLSLVADYMCYEGSYKPFNRVAIESCTSPLQQMSFESTMKFLTNAAMRGTTDHVRSPSACIVTGQVAKGGTGHFTLHYNLAKFL